MSFSAKKVYRRIDCFERFSGWYIYELVKGIFLIYGFVGAVGFHLKKIKENNL